MRVSVLCGGITEVEVSLASAEFVHPIIRELGHSVEVHVLRDRPLTEVLRLSCDIAVILLHGGWGEDGRLQAVLELAEIAFTGSRAAACTIAQNKALAKAVFEASSIPTPAWLALRTAADVRAAVQKLGFPMVVKPVLGGSSEGLFLVSGVDELMKIDRAVATQPHIAERYVAGNILTVPVIDLPGAPRLLPIEIVPTSSVLYDNAAKRMGLRRYNFNPSLPPKTLHVATEIAVRAHRALDCFGITRVDLINGVDGPTVLEVNAIPGMGPSGNLVAACEAQGVTRQRLVNFLLESAR